jgi:chemotaxis protein MotB
MAKQQKCPDCKPGLPGWLATFADLMSLLLTFFVLLLSFSTMNEADFNSAMGSLQGALGVLDGEPILSNPIKLNVPITKGEIREARPTIKDAAAEIEKEVEAEGQEQNVEVIEGQDGLIIRISDKAIFASGKADVKDQVLPLLTRIGAVLNRFPNQIELEGHTDDIPISNDEFPNNHWLSNARALSVLDVFADEVGIERGRLSAIGYGEYKPLVENDSSEMQSRNRRVEIKVRYLQETEDEASPDQVRQLLEGAGVQIENKTPSGEE